LEGAQTILWLSNKKLRPFLAAAYHVNVHKMSTKAWIKFQELEDTPYFLLEPGPGARL
jgi:hypothetical protein